MTASSPMTHTGAHTGAHTHTQIHTYIHRRREEKKKTKKKKSASKAKKKKEFVSEAPSYSLSLPSSPSPSQGLSGGVSPTRGGITGWGVHTHVPLVGSSTTRSAGSVDPSFALLLRGDAPFVRPSLRGSHATGKALSFQIHPRAHTYNPMGVQAARHASVSLCLSHCLFAFASRTALS